MATEVPVQLRCGHRGQGCPLVRIASDKLIPQGTVASELPFLVVGLRGEEGLALRDSRSERRADVIGATSDDFAVVLLAKNLGAVLGPSAPRGVVQRPEEFK